MDMKKLLSIVSGEKQTESKQLNENMESCGAPMSPSMPSTPPVSMSVNLNAQGVDNIKQLLDIMNGASGNKVSPAMAMPQPGMDMPIKITKIGKPEGGNDMSALRDIIAKADEQVTGGFDQATTEPDEEVHGLDAAIPSGDDLHKEKGAYPKASQGDNAMALESSIRNHLDTLYKEIKEASGARATDKKKGKVDKSERKQYFVKLEKDNKTKGMTIVADEGEREGELRDRVKRDNIGWTVASIRVKEEN
jgi:hypothetical protein